MSTRRTRVRRITQYTQSECGLCCAAMILDHWEWHGAIHRLRRDVDTGRDGLSLAAVADLLRSHGMEVQTYRATVAGLRRLEHPTIVFWQDRHVVVVESVDEHWAMVVDPAAGRLRMPVEEFREKFSGIALAATPGEGFTPQREAGPAVWRVLLAAVRHKVTRVAVVVGLVSLVLYSVVLGMPIITERLIDGSFPELPVAGWAFVCVVVFVPLALHVLLGAVRAVLVSALTATLGAELMRTTFATLLSLPYRYFATRSQGELMYRLGSLTQVRDVISGQLLAVVLDVGTLLVSLVYVFWRAPLLGGVTLGLVALIVGLNAASFRKVRTLTDQEIGETAEASGIQMESVSSIVAVKTSGMADRFFASWWSVFRRATELGRKRGTVQGIVSAAVSTLQIFGPFLVLVVGLGLVTDGALDLGVVVASQALTATALGTTTSLSASFMQFVRVHSQVERVGDIVGREPDEEVFADDGPLERLRGEITVDGLVFSYPGAETPSLRDVSFRVPAGHRCAIVGASGSGKSTLGKLLVGLYPADEGTIAIDGRPLDEITEETFRAAVAYVPQDVVLSNRTIAGNIDFTAEEPDLEVAASAASAAHVLPDIQHMPLGLNTEVREMGANLSGGQRQRIAVARALARRPSVLVLDEATSALDAETEARVTAELAQLECTQIVIAHRLSTVMDADTVIVIDQGVVVQSGDPRRLVEEDGRFRDLVALQTQDEMA